jgi:hypothetical protein
LDIYTSAGVPAQPLDMGAGRLDLQRAFDPGVICEPPSLSFGLMNIGDSKYVVYRLYPKRYLCFNRNITIKITNVWNETEIYELYTEYTASGFNSITEMDGLEFPSHFILDPMEEIEIQVRMTADFGFYGDYQAKTTYFQK